jgi:hypothetical protein
MKHFLRDSLVTGHERTLLRAALLLALILMPFLAAWAGSISGHVYTGLGFHRAPIRGAQIQIQGGAFNIVTNTDTEGRYYVTNLPNSTTYTVRCVSTEMTSSPSAHSVTLPSSGPGINGVGRNFTNHLQLSGIVLGQNGQPAAGVTVTYGGPAALDSVNQLAIDYGVGSTNIPSIDLSATTGGLFSTFTNADNFGLWFGASFNVPTAGTYQFHLLADDGATVGVDDTVVVDHDGLHGATERSGSVFLTAGSHTLYVRYFEAGGHARIRLDWTQPGGSRETCAPPGGFHVSFLDMRSLDIASAVSASDGRFTLSNQRIFGRVPLAQMRLRAARAGYAMSGPLAVTGNATNNNFIVTASPPTISAPANVGTLEDTPVDVPVTVNDLQMPPGALAVTAFSSNTNVVSAAGLAISGAGGNRVLRVTPMPGASGSTILSVTVNDGTTSVSTNITLLVTPVNDPPVAGSKFGLALGNFSRASAPSLALGHASFTVEFWGRRTALNGWDVAAGQGNLGANFEALHIGFRPNNSFTFAFYGNDLNTAPITDTDWHHWACTYDKTTGERRIYRDAQLVANDFTTNAFTGGTGPFLVGHANFNNTYFWDGELDEMRVWDHARSADDVSRLRRVPLVGNENGLLAYWRMDENDGGVLRDSSRNGRDATLVNWPNWTRSSGAPGFNAPIVPEDSPGFPIYLPGYDAEALNLTFTNVTVATGTVSRTSGVISNLTHNPLTYIPPADFTGSVALTFMVQDAQGLRDTNTFFLSVQPANDPPVIHALPAQVLLENATLGPIQIRINDPDNDPETLVLSARSSDPSVVSDSGLITGGSGTNRTLIVQPNDGESGTTLITLSVFDGELTAETTFQLRVEPQPAYKIFDLGALPNRALSGAVGINDLGAAAANASANLAGASLRAFINEGLDAGGAITDAGVLGTRRAKPPD